ncbi:MAG: methylated-DNA--[protein]-cysteine S-methyltransferase [Phycisphaeraceae bacterium]|nr:methylated-DNA--[protein]-cysteine S-methyltransferase [Phycisphaeraceae bacterium]
MPSLSTIETPLGPMVAGATEHALCLLEFANRRALSSERAWLEAHYGEPFVERETSLLAETVRQLHQYFGANRREFDLPLDTPGTPFQCSVWSALLKIPFGQTCSYEDIALALGRAGAQRAVGRANGANRIAIVVPCHRVIEKDGSLRGYGGGLDRKRRLLELEGALQPTLFG